MCTYRESAREASGCTCYAWLHRLAGGLCPWVGIGQVAMVSGAIVRGAIVSVAIVSVAIVSGAIVSRAIVGMVAH